MIVNPALQFRAQFFARTALHKLRASFLEQALDLVIRVAEEVVATANLGLVDPNVGDGSLGPLGNQAMRLQGLLAEELGVVEGILEVAHFAAVCVFGHFDQHCEACVG